jgi:hypothetical protein
MARVKFKKLSLQEYIDITVKDNDTLYFTTEAGVPTEGSIRLRIYNGNHMIFDWIALDQNGKLDPSIIPSIAITDTFVVDSEANMLLVEGADVGDIAIRTDENKTYILASSPATQLSNWKWLQTPTDAVLSVNNKTGAVTLKGSDITISNSDTRYISVAIGSLASQINNLITGVSSVNNITGDVILSGLNITVAGPVVSKFWQGSDSTYYDSATTKEQGSYLLNPSNFNIDNAFRTPLTPAISGSSYIQIGYGSAEPYTLSNDPLSLGSVSAYTDRFITGYEGSATDSEFGIEEVRVNYNPQDYTAGSILKLTGTIIGIPHHGIYWAPPASWSYYRLLENLVTDSRSIAEVVHSIEESNNDIENALNWN